MAGISVIPGRYQSPTWLPNDGWPIGSQPSIMAAQSYMFTTADIWSTPSDKIDISRAASELKEVFDSNKVIRDDRASGLHVSVWLHAVVLHWAEK